MANLGLGKAVIGGRGQIEPSGSPIMRMRDTLPPPVPVDGWGVRPWRACPLSVTDDLVIHRPYLAALYYVPRPDGGVGLAVEIRVLLADAQATSNLGELVVERCTAAAARLTALIAEAAAEAASSAT